MTIAATQVAAPDGEALIDFPVAISVTDLEIAAAALPAGDDLVFTAADGTTALATDLESFSQGELVAWVKVPSLSAKQDTQLYVYYGNPSAPGATPEDVWTAGYLSVWHLQQDPGPGGTGDIKDATAANRDGTAQPNMEPVDLVPAQVGRGIAFDGIEDFLDFGRADVGEAFTISMWIRLGAKASSNTLFANTSGGKDADGFKLFVNTANTTNRRLVFEVGSGMRNSGRNAETADGAIPEDSFAHVAVVVDRRAGQARMFVDGTDVTVDSSIGNKFRTDSDYELGRMENGVSFYRGVLDQVEIATTQRPAEWLATAFRNQSAPAAFHRIGVQEDAPPVP